MQTRVSYTIYIFMNVYNRLPDVRRWHVVTNVLIGRISDYFPAPSRTIMGKHNRYWTKFGKKRVERITEGGNELPVSF